eukprot:c21496_g1_i1.p1 GENE.c21496_g1_i1~~c21496_g1_i1.p1  ORF type:complete len:1474 (-),score=658.63 c21496_g1_i1:27-4448(-)
MRRSGSMKEASALHQACAQNKQDVVRSIIQSGIDANLLDKEGKTPLHVALQSENFEIAQILIESKCDITLKDPNNMMPFQVNVKQAVVGVADVIGMEKREWGILRENSLEKFMQSVSVGGESNATLTSEEMAKTGNTYQPLQQPTKKHWSFAGKSQAPVLAATSKSNRDSLNMSLNTLRLGILEEKNNQEAAAAAVVPAATSSSVTSPTSSRRQDPKPVKSQQQGEVQNQQLRMLRSYMTIYDDEVLENKLITSELIKGVKLRDKIEKSQLNWSPKVLGKYDILHAITPSYKFILKPLAAYGCGISELNFLLNIKEDKNKGMYVEGLTKESVASLDDVYDLLRRGDTVRKVASTKMNAGSSRSHSVLTIFLAQTTEKGTKKFSQLNLVDLAGSERLDKTGATGETQKQGALINLSLTTLSLVINSLSKNIAEGKNQPIPYRNSKLTRLLQTSLGGNSKTGLSIHMSPHTDNLEESISTLEFGKRAKMIKTNAKALVQKTAEQLEEEIEKLQKDIAKIKKLLAQFGDIDEEVLKNIISAATGAKADGDDGAGGADSGAGGADGADGGAGGEGGDVGGDESGTTGVDETAMSARQQMFMPGAVLGGVGFEELDAEKEKVSELTEENSALVDENENYVLEIESLKERLKQEIARAEGLQQGLKLKVTEIEKLTEQVKVLTENLPKTQPQQNLQPAPAQKAITGKVGGVFRAKSMNEKDANPTRGKSLLEINDLIASQSQKLNQSRDANRTLKHDNLELGDDVAEKTRKLALAELQVMRYETAKSKSKNAKIKVKIRSQQQNKTIASSESDEPIVMTARTANVSFEEIRKDTVLERFGNLNPIPMEELQGGRSGYLYERLPKKADFVKRFFVIRDSLLLCYDDQNSNVHEPRAIMNLSESKVGTCPKQGDKEYCLMVLSGQNFNVLATATESEKAVWMRDLQLGKYITHSNLVSTAYFNSRVIEALSRHSDQVKVGNKVKAANYMTLGETEYVYSTPLTGCMEGFLQSSGFVLPTTSFGQNKEVKRDWRNLFCRILDSHLLVFDFKNHSDLLTEPLGIIHLGGKVDIIKLNDEEEGGENNNKGAQEDSTNEEGQKKFYFMVSNLAGKHESITFYTLFAEERDRWLNALQVATKVNNFNVLLAAIHREELSIKAELPFKIETDLLGKPLDPCCVQPYNSKGKPLFRHPDGRLLTKELEPYPMPQEVLTKERKKLDYYLRPLPANAVQMFAINPLEPIGVGIDGKHYAYPSAREFSSSDPHYDMDGNELTKAQVLAADEIIPQLKIASILRSATLTREKFPIFDAFGRLITQTRDGALLTLERQQMPSTVAIFDVCGHRIQHTVLGRKKVETLEILYTTNDVKTQLIATIGIEVGYTTLLEVYTELKGHLKQLTQNKLSEISFLDKGIIIPDEEKHARIASNFLPNIFIACRDLQGKRVPEFEGSPLNTIINHEEVDQVIKKERETEFIKQIGIHARKK